jgi:hypothetical protein
MSRVGIGIAALIIAGLAPACGKSNNATGTAGTSGSGTAGTTGAAGTSGTAGTSGAAGTSGDAGTSGAAGTTGTGGSNSDGGVADAFMGTPDAHVPYAAVCPSTVSNKGTCMTATDVQCANGCGPNKSGYKNCDCFSDAWDCPRCEYLPGDYSCYRLPDPLEACPVDPNDAGVTMPQVGTPCTRAACSPCGNASLNSYLDSGGSPKPGFCVCGTAHTWTCASNKEWPQ